MTGCGGCRYLRPSPVHEGLAFCARRSSFVSWTLEECARSEPLTVEDLHGALELQGFVYCLTCRTTLTTGEVEEHLAGGHALSPYILSEDLHEEVYAGD